jgi:hypothetical protein
MFLFSEKLGGSVGTSISSTSDSVTSGRPLTHTGLINCKIELSSLDNLIFFSGSPPVSIALLFITADFVLVLDFRSCHVCNIIIITIDVAN